MYGISTVNTEWVHESGVRLAANSHVVDVNEPRKIIKHAATNYCVVRNFAEAGKL